MIYFIISLLFVLFVLFLVLYILKSKKLNKVWADRDSMAWKYMRLRREFNLLNSSIVDIEDDMPKSMTTPSIGMKLSNEMIRYIEVDESNNKIKARMILPSYSLDDYIKEHPEILDENVEITLGK